MSPILKDVKKELGDQLTVIKVDVDKNPQAAQAYRVQGVPTMILFRKGQPLWRKSGAMPAASLIAAIQKFI
jgi:thioredoxin 1